MHNDAATLKARYRLEEVAAQHVALRRRGARWVGRCPFHEERTPSFTIDPQRQTYRCYGCGQWGDVIAFVARLHGLTFPAALERLRGPDMAGSATARAARPLAPPPGGDAACGRSLTPEEARALAAFVEVCHEELWRAPAVLAYLRGRGVDEGMIARERLGFAGRPTRAVLGRSPGLVEAARRLGLLDRWGRDRLGGRVILPEVRGGQPNSLVARRLAAHGGPQDSPTYLTLTRIARPLLGYEAARAAAGLRGGGLLICEGPFDRLAACAWGYTAVALGSAHPGPRVQRELRALLGEMPSGYLVPDRDRAGHRGMLALVAQLALPAPCTLGVVRLPLGVKDLGELVADPHGQAVFAQRVAQASAARQRHVARVRSAPPPGPAPGAATAPPASPAVAAGGGV